MSSFEWCHLWEPHCESLPLWPVGAGPTGPLGCSTDPLPNWHQPVSWWAVLTAPDKRPVNHVSKNSCPPLLVSCVASRTLEGATIQLTYWSGTVTLSLCTQIWKLDYTPLKKVSDLGTSALWDNYKTFPAGKIKALIDTNASLFSSDPITQWHFQLRWHFQVCSTQKCNCLYFFHCFNTFVLCLICLLWHVTTLTIVTEVFCVLGRKKSQNRQ